MASRKIKLVLSAIMLFCLILITLSFTGVIFPGEQVSEPTDTSKRINGETFPSSGASNNPTEENIIETTAPTYIELIPMPVDQTQPEPPPDVGLRRWPEETGIEILRQPNLDQYIGRSRDQRPLEGITVFLDPGHGGQDGGAHYPAGGNPEIVEKEIVLQVSLLVREKLETLGAKVIMTRENDIWMSLYSRAALVGKELILDFQKLLPEHGYNASPLEPVLVQLDQMLEINSDAANSGGRGIMRGPGASADVRLIFDIQHQYPDALFISLHCNAYPASSQVRGLQVYYLTSDTLYEKENNNVAYQDSMLNEPAYMLYPDAERLRLSTLVRDEILGKLPELTFTGYNDILEDNFAILRQINLPSILLEMGFVTNEQDRKLLQDPVAQSKIADGIAEAVFAYYCQP